MKKILARLVASAVCIPALPSAATVVAVPMPELLGTYSNQARTAAFRLPALPGSIRSVSLRVHGTTTYGTYYCDTGDTVQAATQINAAMAAMPGSWGAGRNLYPPGEFGWTEQFRTQDGANWSFLLDGTGDLYLSGTGIDPFFECHLLGPPAQVVLDDVALLIDGDFPTPSGRPSWGLIKAMYR